MNRRLQLVIILCATTVSVATATHMIVACLKIETASGRLWEIGPTNGRPSAFMAGSSLAADGISWERLSTELDQRIIGWGVAGSSPWEWERFQGRAQEVKVTFLVVSAYDLNEEFVCDFHADVVSPADTISDLWECRADWQFSKRLLSLYPLRYLRSVFPTVGRSDGVMVGLREKSRHLLGFSAAVESEAGPTLATGKLSGLNKDKLEKITNWPSARILRRVASMRGACRGRHRFDGPKNLALLRMLQRAAQRGQVVVVVLPVSPTYGTEFLTKQASLRFEQALSEAQQSVPQAKWVRLDQCTALHSNEYFWDLVHINLYGQQIATASLLHRLKELGLPGNLGEASPRH